MRPGSRCAAISQDFNIHADGSVYDFSDTSTIENSLLVSTKLDRDVLNGQPASVNRDDDGRVDNNGDTNDIEGATMLASTEIERGGRDGNATIDRSYRVYRLTWEGANEQKQQVNQQDVMLQIYMDTLANTAMFKLHAKVVLKHSRRPNKKERVYLYIYPEGIKAITSQITPDERKGSTASANHYSLHFSLTKCPDLIAPKDIPLEAKGKGKVHLKQIQDLATRTQFTVHLASSGTATRDESSFQLLADIFSAQNNKNRPRKYSEHGDIASLYAGNRGKVISTNTCYTDVNSLPPPYINKRQRPDSEEDDRPTVQKRRLPDFEDDTTTKHALRLMQDFWTRFEVKLDEANTRSSNIERSINEVKDRLDNMERSITEMKDKVEGLDTDHNLEVRRDIIEEVEQNCDDYVSELKWTYEDVTQKLDKYCDKAKTDMREACKETIAECDEQCEDIRGKIGQIKGHLTEVAKVFDKFGYT